MADDEEVNSGVFVSDGSESGTFKVKEVEDGEWLEGHTGLEVGNRAFICSYLDEQRLWESDGTQEGTRFYEIENMDELLPLSTQLLKRRVATYNSFI